MITAPYNFVPLNKEVYTPYWADLVSHDIPFEDGESGEIDITITAKSPIFIKDSKNKEEFCNHNGQYYIPSSSIKGMVRNVLEIMSFSKMNFINDTTYSLRDLKYQKYMDKIKKGISCGWLYKDNEGNFKIEDCGEPYRIKYDEIDKKFNINFKQKFMEGTFDNAKSPFKNAFEKYKLFKEDIYNTSYKFSTPKSDMAGRKIVTFDDTGKVEGKLVLTGHPSSRKENSKKPSGKIYDFVFTIKENPKIYEVDEKVFDNFKFAYFDGRDKQPEESKDWTFWKRRLYSGEKIPVFFYKEIEKITSFGLSYLYKFPYDKSIMEALLKSHFTARLDLSETIFGFSKKINEEQKSLKGRVVFSHGFSKENKRIELLETRNILLGSPKASYYPIYLIQNGKEYKTLMDEESVLAGWKRYPIHKNFSHKGEVKSKQTNTITPIKENSIFKCKIKVHNLKPIEIGALLSALTFHNTKNCFHSIGMGKSCGYGKVEIEVSNLKNFKYSNIDYMKFFEASLNGDLFDKKIFWHKSEQIVNLLTMATEQNDSNLKYMELKDFASNKNKNEDGTYNYLDRYVNLNGVKKTETNSLVEESDIVYYEDYIQKYKKFYFEEEERKKIIEEKKRKKEEVKAQLEKDWNFAISSTNIDTLKNFIEKYPNELEKIGKINQTISKLEDKEKQEKEEKRQKEANEKWLSIKKLENKFMQKALEDFISNYPYFKDIAIVQKELENFSKSSKSSSTNISIDDLANAKDGKKVKSILEKLSIDENNISKIISSIKEVYSNMKPKDQKSFFKDAQLGRFIGKESEEELKNFFN